MTDTVEVSLAGRSYAVVIGSGLLDHAAEHAAPLLRNAKVLVVADAAAKAHHGDRLHRSLTAAGHSVEWFEVAGGERAKSWETLQQLTDWMLDHGIERGDSVLALGGGVVGDLTGFACAIVKRGCNFVQLPTTLLAQVDSSVGGKTAINTSAGKNLIGAFHQPSLVLADLQCLVTLPERELRAGYAEVIKYGLLGDAGFFGWCEQNGPGVIAGDTDARRYAIRTSIEAKARIVAEDEREMSGRRALLNLGHTFGHALEAETGFSDRLLHGEGVALGMVLAARYSARLGQITTADSERVAAAIASAGLPGELAALGLDTSGQRLADHMRHDKKASGGTVPFLLLNAIGDAYLDAGIDLADVAVFLDEQLRAH